MKLILIVTSGILKRAGVLLMMCVLFTMRVCAQDYMSNFDKTLTPSPMVGSLGNFAGMGIKKNTGGIQKSIALLQVKEADFVYNPSIEYFSTGIRVDDWGSRVGIGWTENLTAVISRVVKNLPDEKAETRVGDGPYEFGDYNVPEYTEAYYQKAKSLENQLSLKDGEYDIFYFNIFGTSGSFIIRNTGQVVLLTNDNSFKIEVLTTTPTYQFILTDIKGAKYYFTSSIEMTKFSNDNACDIENPHVANTAMAWFVDKIVSPVNHTVNFTYDDREYGYIYDFSESYVFSDLFWNSMVCATPPQNGTHTYCVRRKNTKTKILSSVTGDNFGIYFDYIGRNDIYNESLLDKITLFNNEGILKEVQFYYKEVVATSNYEPLLLSSLPDDPWEHNALKTRYYLDTLKIAGSQGVYEQVYSFGYLNANDLPHRYSLSQDYIGCYNGRSNLSFIPRLGHETIPQVYLDQAAAVPFANRNPFLIGTAGLLNVVKYPTGGKDSIIYEQNEYRTRVFRENTSTYTDWYACEEWPSYGGGFFDMTVPYEGEIDLKVDCYYDDEKGPMTHPEEEYWAEFELWSSEGRMTFPDGSTNVQLQPGYSYHSSYFNNNYFQKLVFNPANDYWLQVNIVGKNTTLRARLSYVSYRNNDIVDSAYVGYRVKKVISNSNFETEQVKSYSYNDLRQINDRLIMSDSSSLQVAPINKYWELGMYFCDELLVGGLSAIPLFKFMHRNNADFNKYGGFPYSYKNVTEFLDTAKSSFIASEFRVSGNTYAGRILPDKYPLLTIKSPDMTNAAWENGIEVNRYYGAREDSVYAISSQTAWNYSDEENIYYNYGAYLLFPVDRIYTDPRSNLGAYMIKGYENYSHWVKLDSVRETSYIRNGVGFSTISNKIAYRYNAADKLLMEEETTSSKGEILLKQVIRPTKMVALNRDPLGIYQGMINNRILAPEVEVVTKRGTDQTGLVRHNYFQPFTNLYVPESIQTQRFTTDPTVTQLKFLRYDNKGNVLSLSRDGGPATNYIWSYKGKYPVAKIENCDYGAIESAIGATAISNFTGLNPSGANIDILLLPLKTARPKAFITRYTYIPQVGAIDVIDPKGQTTYYEYDNFQRLKAIKDHHGNIIKSFDYHYSN